MFNLLQALSKVLVWDSYWADDHVVVASVATDVAAASDDADNGHGDGHHQTVIVPSVPATIGTLA